MNQNRKISTIALYLMLIGARNAAEEGEPANYVVLTRSGSVILNARLLEESAESVTITTPGAEKPLVLRKSQLFFEHMQQYNSHYARSSNIQTTSLNSSKTRVAAHGSYGLTTGPLKALIPSGYSVGIACDHRFFSNLNAIVPWFSIELGYFSLVRSPIEVTGYALRAGPIWFLAINALKSQVYASVVAGQTLLNVRDASRSGEHIAFTTAAILGYEQQVSQLGVFVQSRFEYFFDPQKPLSAFAGAVGVSYRFSGDL
jgi:hypothetical protein